MRSAPTKLVPLSLYTCSTLPLRPNESTKSYKDWVGWQRMCNLYVHRSGSHASKNAAKSLYHASALFHEIWAEVIDANGCERRLINLQSCRRQFGHEFLASRSITLPAKHTLPIIFRTAAPPLIIQNFSDWRPSMTHPLVPHPLVMFNHHKLGKTRLVGRMTGCLVSKQIGALPSRPPTRITPCSKNGESLSKATCLHLRVLPPWSVSDLRKMTTTSGKEHSCMYLINSRSASCNSVTLNSPFRNCVSSRRFNLRKRKSLYLSITPLPPSIGIKPEKLWISRSVAPSEAMTCLLTIFEHTNGFFFDGKGDLGQYFSTCQRNRGPVNHWLACASFFARSPLVASSSGLAFEFTKCHCDRNDLSGRT